MITFHPDFTMAEVARIANYLDANLIQDGRGNLVITPRQALQSNANVVKMPRRKRQIVGADLPTGPEGAA